jgi:hypothetical protein
MQMDNVPFIEAAINKSFEELQCFCLGYNAALIDITEERHVRNAIYNAGNWQPGTKLFIN